MDFKFNGNGEVTLVSTNVNLDDRWILMTTKQMENTVGGRWGWFYGITSRENERTRIHLGYDDVVGRPVMIKTVEYRLEDMKDEQAILNRRRILIEQIELLNNISSPLLPEPLDWFTIENTIDGIPEELTKTEPVIVLDYLPGKSLLSNINKKRFRFPNSDEVHTPRVARFVLKILYFLRTLKEKNYAYLALSPEHILLLKDDIPRFIGLGRICKVVDGHLDASSSNFSRTVYGYSAPELNSPDTNWGEYASPEQVGAFSLGVILHQLVYENTEITKEMIKNGSFIYPNGVSEDKIRKEKNGNKIHELITDLCNHDPDKRLTDFNLIEKRLRKIEGAIIEAELKAANRKGYVKFYDRYKGYGYIVDNNSTNEVYVSEKDLNDSGLDNLNKNSSVKFDVFTSGGKTYASNIEIIQQQPRREYVPPRSTPDPKDNTDSSKPKDAGWCFISTAAYGTTTSEKLDTLRWFRDDILKTNKLGRKLLLKYFKTSPKISHKLRGMKIRKAIVRNIIDFSAKLIEKVQQEEEGSLGYWSWIVLSVLVYYSAFALAYMFVLPERILGIDTTDSRGEEE